MSSLRIAHIINNLGLGGAEILLKNTIELMPAHQHLIIYLSPPEDVLKSIKGNVKAVCLYNKSWLSFYKSVSKAKKLLQEWEPSIVHAHLFDATILARFATPRSTPLVATIHSTYSHDAFQNKKALWLERLTAYRQDAVIAVSKYVLTDYLNEVKFKKKTFILYNFTPIKDNGLQVPPKNIDILNCVAVGSLKEAKNYDYLIAVFGLLKDQNVSLDIYGEGPLKEQLQKKIDEANVNVKLRGATDKINEVLQHHDVFIQASKHEGYGISVAEAMRCKIPLFLSDIPVFREVSNGNAVFFSLDKPEVAATLLLSLQDPILRKKISNDAGKHAEGFDSGPEYSEKLLNIYYSTIARKVNNSQKKIFTSKL